MKRRVAVWMAAVLIGFSCLAIASVAIILVNNRYYSPSDQQRSAFLIAYNPGNVIAPFVDKSQGRQTGSGSSSGAGTLFVTHTVEFEEYFTTQKQNENGIMAAVGEDLERQLQLRGVRILLKQKGPDNVLHISYTTGPVLGSIALHPLTQDLLVHRASNTLEAAEEDVILHVAIEEKWFPNGIPSSQELAQIER